MRRAELYGRSAVYRAVCDLWREIVKGTIEGAGLVTMLVVYWIAGLALLAPVALVVVFVIEATTC